MIETFGVNPFICTSCGNEIDQFKPRRIVDTDESDQMPELVCPNFIQISFASEKESG